MPEPDIETRMTNVKNAWDPASQEYRFKVSLGLSSRDNADHALRPGSDIRVQRGGPGDDTSVRPPRLQRRIVGNGDA